MNRDLMRRAVVIGVGLGLILGALLALAAARADAPLDVRFASDEYAYEDTMHATVSCSPFDNRTCVGDLLVELHNENRGTVLAQETAAFNVSASFDWKVQPKWGFGTYLLAAFLTTKDVGRNETTLYYAEASVKVIMGEEYRHRVFLGVLHDLVDNWDRQLDAAISQLWFWGILVLVVEVFGGLLLIAAIAQKAAHARNNRGPLDRLAYSFHLVPDPLGELYGRRSGGKITRIEMELEAAQLQLEGSVGTVEDKRELVARLKRDLGRALEEGVTGARKEVTADKLEAGTSYAQWRLAQLELKAKDDEKGGA